MISQELSQVPQTDDITSRVVRLEISNFYERQSAQAQIDDMHRRLYRLEIAPQRALDNSGWLKICVALLLPLIVFLITGSVEKAVSTAATIVGKH